MSDSASAAIVERSGVEHLDEVLVDGQRAGFTAYRDRDGQRVFFHTEIDRVDDASPIR